MTGKNAIERNIQLLKDKDPAVRRNAAEMLGRSMDPRATKPLIKLLQAEQIHEVRRAIVLSLSLLGGDEVLEVLLEVLKNDDDSETRRNAAGGLRFFTNK
ncbi:MAG: hypothetical protein DRO63_08560, partial [Candidatus Gerdarchaeota archaeon]